VGGCRAGQGVWAARRGNLRRAEVGQGKPDQDYIHQKLLYRGTKLLPKGDEEGPASFLPHFEN